MLSACVLHGWPRVSICSECSNNNKNEKKKMNSEKHKIQLLHFTCARANSQPHLSQSTVSISVDSLCLFDQQQMYNCRWNRKKHDIFVALIDFIWSQRLRSLMWCSLICIYGFYICNACHLPSFCVCRPP